MPGQPMDLSSALAVAFAKKVSSTRKPGDDRVWLSCAETSTLIRAALRVTFPATRFSVHSKTYTGGASISVRWTDGPTRKRVDEVLDLFERSRFDGMTDSRSLREPVDFDGVPPFRSGADFVFGTREVSAAFGAKVNRAVCRYWGITDAPEYDTPGWHRYIVPNAGHRHLNELHSLACADRTTCTFEEAPRTCT